jgi:flagella basal body P-ring formation protein FlgA
MARLLPLIFAFALSPPAALADTVIAARTIRAQSVITSADVTVVADDVAGTYISLEEVIGLEARVALFAGRPVRVDELGPPAIIERNQIVTLYYHSSVLMIAAEGRALARAGIGDRLRVMNLSSRQTLTGLVQEDGTVSVGPTTSNFLTN